MSLTCGQVSDVSRAALIYYAKVFSVKIKHSDQTMQRDGKPVPLSCSLIPGNHRGLFDSAESLKNCLSSVSKQHSSTRLSNVLLFPCKTWAPELPQMGMDWRESHLVPESGGLWPHWLARIEKENMLYWEDVSFMDSSSNLVFSGCSKLYLFSSF